MTRKADHLTLLDLIAAVQDCAGNDAEVVAVLTRLFWRRRVTRRVGPHAGDAALT